MSKKTKRTLKTIGICVVAFVLTLGLFSMLNNAFGWINVETAHVVEAKDVKTLEETKWVFNSTIDGVDGEKAFVIDIEIDSENKDLPSDKFTTIINTNFNSRIVRLQHIGKRSIQFKLIMNCPYGHYLCIVNNIFYYIHNPCNIKH